VSDSLYHALNSLDALDLNLKEPAVQNFVSALHSRMRQRKVEDAATLPDTRTCLAFGPVSTLRALKGAVEAGTAENYTFHFAFTVLALYWELEKRNPEMLAEIRATTQKSREWNEGFLEYCKTLAEKA
jgi:hypothetical protein